MSDPKSYIGSIYVNSKNNTECVEFARQAGGAPHTSKWKAGGFISLENSPPRGTWVATFVDGKYHGHVGVFNGFSEHGDLHLIDQYKGSKNVKESTYHKKSKNWNGSISNDPSKYQILKW